MRSLRWSGHWSLSWGVSRVPHLALPKIYLVPEYNVKTIVMNSISQGEVLQTEPSFFLSAGNSNEWASDIQLPQRPLTPADTARKMMKLQPSTPSRSKALAQWWVFGEAGAGE
jgi:hypothetical protein